MGSSVSAFVGAVGAYLPVSNSLLSFLQSGPSLLLVAILVWSLRVLDEFQVVFGIVEGLSYAPRASHTCMEATGTSIRITTLSAGRLSWGIALSLLRFATCATLW